MGKDTATGVFAILTSIVGVAIISVIVSKNSQTSSVIDSLSNFFSTALKTAVSPITSSNNGL